ncbi:DNA adenine methylase [Caulobacter sp. BE254]|uniref:DNA adenine methylase n=1 Tax=Caulobacter sp. BE254 TaxID=2817720 RepID=UPI0038572BCF
MDVEISPFLKWAGGKRWLCKRFPELFPTTYNRYFEPFLGSGAVFFHLKPERAILSDRNPDLVKTYNAIKNDWEAVHDLLSNHARSHNDKYYYEVRATNPESENETAARFLYLNRTCWNGLYRVNTKGIFNVPRGTKDNVLLPTDDFPSSQKALKRASIACRDFSKTISLSRKDDFIFIDPPYTVAHNLNGFVKYNDKIFTWNDQIRLRDSILAAAQRGTKILVTNADHSSIRSLYEGIGEHFPLDRATVISGDASGRRGTTELAIAIGYQPNRSEPKSTRDRPGLAPKSGQECR